MTQQCVLHPIDYKENLQQPAEGTISDCCPVYSSSLVPSGFCEFQNFSFAHYFFFLFLQSFFCSAS